MRPFNSLSLSFLMTGLVVVSLLFSVSVSAQDKSLTAKEIMDKAIDQNQALGITQGSMDIKLVIEDRTGTRRTRLLGVKSAKVDETVRRLVKITSPKELAGQAFLFSENKSAEDDVWMYLPAFKVSRRVEGSQKKGAFLGSHFSFADLESRDLKAADYKRLDDEKIANDPVYVISVTPKDKASSEYGKIKVYVSQASNMLSKIRFYDKEGKEEIKTLFVEKITKGETGSAYISQMTLRSKKGGYSTIIISNADFDASFPTSLFTREQLGK